MAEMHICWQKST